MVRAHSSGPSTTSKYTKLRNANRETRKTRSESKTHRDDGARRTCTGHVSARKTRKETKPGHTDKEQTGVGGGGGRGGAEPRETPSSSQRGKESTTQQRRKERESGTERAATASHAAAARVRGTKDGGGVGAKESDWQGNCEQAAAHTHTLTDSSTERDRQTERDGRTDQHTHTQSSEGRKLRGRKQAHKTNQMKREPGK